MKKMHSKFIALIFILFSFNNVKVEAQTHVIFLDDSMYYSKINTRTYYGSYKIDFKDSLEDGLWIMHYLYKKDSCLANDSTIILKGSYKNNVKQGVFYIFYSLKYIAITEIYDNGLLNGLCVYPGRTTMYKNGKKDGIEYVPSTDDRICTLEVNIYSNDTLIKWYEYDYNVLLQIGERIGNQEYKAIVFNKNGIKEYELYYKDEDLYKYFKFYPNGKIQKEAVGVCYFTKRSELSKKKLGVQKLGGHPSNLVFRSEGALEMINGLEKLYDEQGILIIENKYVEGKIVE
jgi:antitoxin component YwqK of YwqJK toxin-antitoxin module